MSAGRFESGRYQSDTLDVIMSARVQPETKALVLGGATNEDAGSVVTLPLRVNISGTKNSLGVKPRTVTVKWVVNPPEGYEANGRLVIPILTKTLWDAVDEDITTGTYLGASVIVIGKSPETKR